MRKLLLVFAVIISTALSSRADVAAIVASGATYDGTGTAAEFSTNTGSIEGVCSFAVSAYNAKDIDLRIYANTNLTITPEEGITITDITFTDTNTKSVTLTLKSADGKLATTNRVTTWTGSTTSPIVISVSAQVRVKFIEITYTKDSSVVTKEPAGLAFTEEAYTANLGEDFTAELTNPNGLEVTYKSSNEAVATVATDGNVTTLAAGTTTITATSEETKVFKAGEASYKLTVIDPNSTEDKIVFESLGYSDGTALTTVTKGKSTLTFAKGSNSNNAPKYYVSDKTARLYSGNTLTIAVDESCYITEIVFGGSTLGALTASAGSYNNKTWTPTVARSDNKISNVTFTATGKPRFSSITVKYALIPSGIADIEAEENGAVEYFNLQGVRVAEPANGLYIRRAGNKVEKVVIR